jgi:PKD repeat protein
MKKWLTLLAGAVLLTILISCSLTDMFAKKECQVTCDASAAPNSGTAPLSVVFMGNATVTDCKERPFYFWEFGDGGTSTSQNTSHVYQSAGTYVWTLTVNAGTAQATKSGSVTVEEKKTYYYRDRDDDSSGPVTTTGGNAGLGVKLITNINTGLFRVKVNDQVVAEHSFQNSKKNIKNLKKFLRTKDLEWARELKVPAGNNKIKFHIQDDRGSVGNKVVNVHFKPGQHHAYRIVVRGAPGDMRVEVIE